MLKADDLLEIQSLDVKQFPLASGFVIPQAQ